MAVVPDLAKPWVPVDRRVSPNPGATNARQANVITPSDSVDLDPHIDAIYVGVTGNLTVIPRESQTGLAVLFSNVPVGWFPVACKRIMATGTTATGLVGVLD